jgi:hypothetical protein
VKGTDIVRIGSRPVAGALVGLLLSVPGKGAHAQPSAADGSRLEVRVDFGEAEAALAILEKQAAGLEVTEEDWARLESSEGWLRMRQRNAEFGRTSFPADVRAYLTSGETVARAGALRAAVESWRGLDARAAASRALAYLPDETSLRATIYPAVKPRPNSYVYELETNPAIFFHVDPDRSPGQLENTLAHELHHVGSATCPEPPGLDTLPEEARLTVSWLSAFGEGMAVLAAAGGPDVHPHATSAAGEWLVWERDVANIASDVGRVEAFFTAILDGRLAGDEARAELFSLINAEGVPQGPFYTVGWKMAAIVERAFGRPAVVAAVCDPRRLLVRYNAAARAYPRPDATPLPLWSEAFLRRIDAAD